MRLIFCLSAAAALVSAQGTITTVAGGGSVNPGDGSPATSVSLFGASGVTVDRAGNIYFVEPAGYRVRKIDTAGIIATIAGTGDLGIPQLGSLGDGGPATKAKFAFGGLHEGIALDSSGNIYVTDSGNYRVRKIDTSGIVTTFVGSTVPVSGGDGGPASKATLGRPYGVAVDAHDNVYIADATAARVRKVDTLGIITTVAGTGISGTSGDGGLATKAGFNSPISVAVDGAGNLFIADQTAQLVRKVDTNGIINTVAGSGNIGFLGDGGPATKAYFQGIQGICVDPSGTLYIVDNGNHRIRKVDTNGIITTFAGNGNSGVTGDGGPATSATLVTPSDVFLDSTGSLFISDNAGRIRKVAAAPGAAPSVTLIANAFGDAPLIAPNTWVEIKGSNLAPASSNRIWLDADFVNSKLPTQLDGVSVTVNGKSAYIYYVSPAQLNILTPPDAITGTTQVQVSNGALTSGAINVQAQPQSLSFFEFVSSSGKQYVYGRHISDGTLIGPASLFPGLTTPVKPGELISIAADGFGPTDVPVVSGSLTQSGNLPAPLPVIKIGGIQADVRFAGLAGVGTYQINLIVPPGVPDGDNTITATYNGLSIQPNLSLTVQH